MEKRVRVPHKPLMKIKIKKINNIVFWVVTNGNYTHASKDLGKAILKCINKMPS
jgi:hypothetical protein